MHAAGFGARSAALAASSLKPYAHQMNAVYGAMLPQPRLRFLLADEPGTGETIMVGLYLREMQRLGFVRSALVVVPAHLPAFIYLGEGDQTDQPRVDRTFAFEPDSQHSSLDGTAVWKALVAQGKAFDTSALTAKACCIISTAKITAGHSMSSAICSGAAPACHCSPRARQTCSAPSTKRSRPANFALSAPMTSTEQ